MAQRSDKSLRAPMAERGMIDQPLPTRCLARGLSHVGFQPGFVKKADALQHMRHEELAMRPPNMPLAPILVRFCSSA